MNNFYDDAFDMVPYETPNLAVEQLAVNENGDVTVEGALSVTGSLKAQTVMDVGSDGTNSYINMRGRGHPSTGDPDAQICCLNGDANTPNNGQLLLSAGTGITLKMSHTVISISIPIMCT